MAVDVLHHHNRIVDHKAHGHHNRHQRQVVQAEPEHVHQGKAGNQRHPQHGRHNQRGRPLAQEQRHDRDHQEHRDQQGDFHFMQRGADGLGPVAQHRDLDRGREHGLQAGQGSLNAVDGLDNVGPRLARNHQVDPWLVARPGLHVIILGAVDHPRHVAQLHRGAVFV